MPKKNPALEAFTASLLPGLLIPGTKWVVQAPPVRQYNSLLTVHLRCLCGTEHQTIHVRNIFTGNSVACRRCRAARGGLASSQEHQERIAAASPRARRRITTDEAIDRLAGIIAEAKAAFAEDPSYATAMATRAHQILEQGDHWRASKEGLSDTAAEVLGDSNQGAPDAQP